MLKKKLNIKADPYLSYTKQARPFTYRRIRQNNVTVLRVLV